MIVEKLNRLDCIHIFYTYYGIHFSNCRNNYKKIVEERYDYAS